MAKTGDKIGPYVLLRELGWGGFGVVWLAERRGSLATTQVAVKLPLDIEPDFEALAREARIWVHASGHPNVLPVIEADVYDGQIVIVSEYAAGGSLSAWLRQQPKGLPVLAKAREMATGILDGLSHLHSKGIVHRDLKPANILLQGDIPRLTDFGVARVLKAGSHSHTAGGTPAYMAPEAWDGHRSESSDLWSVGVILYEMLAGTRPFPQSELLPLYRAIASTQPAPLPSSVPDGLVRVVQRALDKNPEGRYRSACDMLSELRIGTRVAEDSTGDFLSQRCSDNLVHQLWRCLEPELQDALALAFNQARREGKNRISTRTFFAALARLKPGRLSELLELLPGGSLPEPIAEDVPVDRRILEDQPELSTCVENALLNLGGQASPEHKLGAQDVFVDVAKFGTGPSVTQLRVHGFTPDQIDRLVGQLGLRVVRRR
jgi:serine/threonine protein kinase